MPVTLYRSSDTDAPQFVRDSDRSTQFQNFMNVIKACLVDGYGDKPAAGWSVKLEGTDDNGYETVVLQNAGTGMCAMFKHNGDYLELSVAKDITGLNRDASTHITPLTSYPLGTVDVSVAFASPDKISINIFSPVTDGSTTEWALIANEKTFYLLTQYDNNAPEPVQMLAVGDWRTDYSTGYEMFTIYTSGRTLSLQPAGIYGINVSVYYPYYDIGERFLAIGHPNGPTFITNDLYISCPAIPMHVSTFSAPLSPIMISWPSVLMGWDHQYGHLPGMYAIGVHTPTMFQEVFRDKLNYPATSENLAPEITLNGKQYILHTLSYTKTLAISLDDGDW